MKKVLRRVLYPIAAAWMAAALFGCAKNDGDVTNPNPDQFKPVGTVQGVLTDSVTQQPIVGAVVDIGVQKATTTSNGQFVLRNVPANQGLTAARTLASEGDYYAADWYTVTIDMTGVSSPVDMRVASPTPYAYPRHVYTSVRLSWTSLDDTNGDVPGAGSGSNHDTPVNNLVAALPYSVGKLAATIRGTVVSESTNLPVSEGYVVKLQADGSDNDGTGANKQVLATATPAADGTFSFANVEVFQDFDLYVFQNDVKVSERVDVRTPSDGQTVVANTLVVLDDAIPYLVSTSPEWGSDLAPSDAQTVVFTFSEPIKPTAYALATDAAKAAINGIYNDVSVSWDATKVQLDRDSNVQYTLAWNEDMTALTVTLKTGVSALYTVELASHEWNDDWYVGGNDEGLDNHLFDLTGNKVRVDLANRGEVRFSTSGGLLAAKPEGLTVTNASSIDWNGEADFDWAPASGAKTYNLYCTAVQLWEENSNQHQFLKMNEGPITASEASSDNDNFELVENNQIALKGLCYVVGVNSDGLEGPASDIVEIQDVVKPRMTYLSPSDALSLPDVDTTSLTELTIYFSEPMDEATVTDETNYTFTPAVAGDVVPVAVSALYDATDWTVTLTVEMANPAPGGTFSGEWTLALNTDAVADVAGNLLDPAYSTYVETVEPPLPALPALDLPAATVSAVNFNGFGAGTDTVVDWLPLGANDDEYVLTLTRTSPLFGVTSSSVTILNGVTQYDLANFGPLSLVDADPDNNFLFRPVQYTLSMTTYDVFGSALGISPSITLQDLVGPEIASVVSTVALPAEGTGLVTLTGTVTVTFNEYVNSVDAEAIANYAIASAAATVPAGQVLPTVKEAEFNPQGPTVTLTLQANKAAAGDTLHADWILRVLAMRDIASNAIDATADEWAAGAFPTRDPVVTANPF